MSKRKVAVSVGTDGGSYRHCEAEMHCTAEVMADVTPCTSTSHDADSVVLSTVAARDCSISQIGESEVTVFKQARPFEAVFAANLSGIVGPNELSAMSGLIVAKAVPK